MRIVRNAAEVSLYLGLATAIATFSAAAVALGLLQRRRRRERLASVGVLLCATLGAFAALATVARGQTSAVANVLVGVGVLTTASFVLLRALRLIFTESGRDARSAPAAANATHAGARFVAPGASLPAPTPFVPAAGAPLRRAPFLASSGLVVGAVLVAGAFIAPELPRDLLRSRPLGSSGTPRESLVAAARCVTPPGSDGPAVRLRVPVWGSAFGPRGQSQLRLRVEVENVGPGPIALPEYALRVLVESFDRDAWSPVPGQDDEPEKLRLGDVEVWAVPANPHDVVEKEGELVTFPTDWPAQALAPRETRAGVLTFYLPRSAGDDGASSVVGVALVSGDEVAAACAPERWGEVVSPETI